MVEERKRRKLTVALVASVLGTFAVALGGWAWIERQRNSRVAIQEVLEGRKLDFQWIMTATSCLDELCGEHVYYLDGEDLVNLRSKGPVS